MTVRINIDGIEGGETIVSVHGWIEGDEEAREVLRVVRDSQAPVVLDLCELQTADASGLKALNTLATEGTRLTRESDFIKLLLESNGSQTPVAAGESIAGAS